MSKRCKDSLGYNDLEFDWISNPINQSKNEKLLMQQLQKDCDKIGLKFIPHVFIVQPRSKPIEPLSPEPIDYVDSNVDEIGPFIIFRADVYAALNLKEDEAVDEHELLHVKRLCDYMLSTGADFSTRPEKSLAEQREEGIGCRPRSRYSSSRQRAFHRPNKG